MNKGRIAAGSCALYLSVDRTGLRLQVVQSPPLRDVAVDGSRVVQGSNAPRGRSVNLTLPDTSQL
jgi:hypothetical protein